HATLRPNSAYWLMYNTNGAGDAANNMNYLDDDVPQAYSSRSVLFGTWPESFGDATTASGAFSIYATYASSAAASAPDTSPNWLALLLIAMAAALAIAGGAIFIVVRLQNPARALKCKE